MRRCERPLDMKLNLLQPRALNRQLVGWSRIGYLLLAAVFLAACRAASSEAATPAAPGPTATFAPSPTPAMVLEGTGPDRAQEGRSVFLATCAVCHGTEAEGYANELAAPALNASEHAWEHADPQAWIRPADAGLWGAAYGRRSARGDRFSAQPVDARAAPNAAGFEPSLADDAGTDLDPTALGGVCMQEPFGSISCCRLR